jgi:hypothetical protein
MITKPFARSLGLILTSILFGLFLAGCATNEPSPVDWNSRIGNFTFDQAKTELGAPNQSHNQPGGGTVAEWITRRNVGGSGMEPLHAGGVDQSSGQVLSSLPKNEYLVLSFDPTGKLIKWQRVVR